MRVSLGVGWQLRCEKLKYTFDHDPSSLGLFDTGLYGAFREDDVQETIDDYKLEGYYPAFVG